jgi:sugar phosphate isomerase/epimerase
MVKTEQSTKHKARKTRCFSQRIHPPHQENAMTPEINIQLYTVRDQIAENYEATIRAIAEIGFPCVEPAGYPGTTPEAAAKLFKELGLRAPSAIIGLPVGDQKNEILDEAQLMGHEAVMTGMPPRRKEHYSSLDEVKAMADLYTEAAANAAEVGIQVGYHNHDWDLCEIDGARAYKTFLKHTPETVLWEADIFWAARAGLDPAEFIRELGPRGKFLHFKDGRISTGDDKSADSDPLLFLPAGKGDVDFAAAAAAATWAQYLAVELDKYEGDMMEAVAESYRFLTQKGYAKGNK